MKLHVNCFPFWQQPWTTCKTFSCAVQEYMTGEKASFLSVQVQPSVLQNSGSTVYMLCGDAIVKHWDSVFPRRRKENIQWEEEKQRWKRMSLSSSTESQLQFDSALTNTHSMLTGITGLFFRPEQAAVFYYAVKSTSFSSFALFKTLKCRGEP